MKITNDPALIAANKAYDLRVRGDGYRYGLITGAAAGVAVTVWVCIGLFVLFIRNQ